MRIGEKFIHGGSVYILCKSTVYTKKVHLISLRTGKPFRNRTAVLVRDVSSITPIEFTRIIGDQLVTPYVRRRMHPARHFVESV